METKRMPRSQFLKLTMKNKKNNEKKKKKRIQRVNAAPRKLIIKKEYKFNKKSPVCFVLKI